MSINGPEDIGVSRTGFFTGSLAMFGGGLLFGVYRVFKKEKTRLDIKTQKPQVMIAFKALAYGTALCFGAFAAAGAVFTYTTKVTTAKEFDTWARKWGALVPVPRVEPTVESEQEAKEVEALVASIVGATLSGNDDNENKSEDDATTKT